MSGFAPSFPPPGPSFDEINDFCGAAGSDIVTVKKYLDAYGPDIINRRDNIKACALTWAAWAGNTEIVEFLLDRGAYIDNRGTLERTALAWAAITGSNEVVELLLERGASPEIKDQDGYTALQLAEGGGHSDTAAVIKNWAEARERQRAEVAAQAAAKEQAAARLEKLKKQAPAKTGLKNKTPKNKF